MPQISRDPQNRRKNAIPSARIPVRWRSLSSAIDHKTPSRAGFQPLSNFRQERFAEGLATVKSVSEAYKEAGYKGEGQLLRDYQQKSTFMSE